ncbi:MAG: hypothetical protein J0I00_17635 [Burkholderiales bacterium]|nr:hypothetical protein [Burkholderiales bacterium]
MKAPAPVLLAWHYTIHDKRAAIDAAGELRPADAFIGANERPVIWFSLNQRWEPTASKGIIDAKTGARRTATIAEMVELGGGPLLRYGIAPRLLLPSNELRLRARISGRMWRGMVASGRAIGANPSDWFGSLQPVAVAQCVVQVSTDGRTWVDAATGGEG